MALKFRVIHTLTRRQILFIVLKIYLFIAGHMSVRSSIYQCLKKNVQIRIQMMAKCAERGTIISFSFMS